MTQNLACEPWTPETANDRFRAAVVEARKARAELPEPARYESGASIALHHAADALAAAHRVVADAGLPINGVLEAAAAARVSAKLAFDRGRAGDTDAFRPTHTHLKTGGLYQTLDVVTDATNATNGRKLVLYRNSEGRHFVRLQDEFHDGRFRHVGVAAPSKAQS